MILSSVYFFFFVNLNLWFTHLEAQKTGWKNNMFQATSEIFSQKNVFRMDPGAVIIFWLIYTKSVNKSCKTFLLVFF